MFKKCHGESWGYLLGDGEHDLFAKKLSASCVDFCLDPLSGVLPPKQSLATLCPLPLEHTVPGFSHQHGTSWSLLSPHKAFLDAYEGHHVT